MPQWVTWWYGLVVLPCRHAVGSRAQSSSSKDTQPKTEVYKWRISFTSHRLQHNTEVKINDEILYISFVLCILLRSDQDEVQVLILIPQSYNFRRNITDIKCLLIFFYCPKFSAWNWMELALILVMCEEEKGHMSRWNKQLLSLIHLVKFPHQM